MPTGVFSRINTVLNWYLIPENFRWIYLANLFKEWILFFWGFDCVQSEWTPVKFIAYVYIHFNQNVNEKSDISAKIDAGKHLHAVFLLTAEQRQWCRRRPIRL